MGAGGGAGGGQSGGAIKGKLDDVSTTVAVENKTADVRITPQRALHTNLRNQAGTEVGTASDPLNVDVTGSVGGVSLENAIDSTAFDLNAAAFSATSSISVDYKLDNIKLNFSTAESKTITITGPDGTDLYKDTNTAQSVIISEMDMGFNASENFTVAVTQFSSAGTMDCIAVVQTATAALVGTPNVKITDGTDTMDVVGDGDDLDIQDLDGTVGTTKGITIFAKDVEDKARYLSVAGPNKDELKVFQNPETAEMLVQLKLIVSHLSIVTGENLTEDEIGEDLS